MLKVSKRDAQDQCACTCAAQIETHFVDALGWPCQYWPMPSAVAKSKITEILQEATSLSAAQLDKLLPQIVALRLEKRKLVIPRRQSELLKSINRSLSPQKRRLYQRLQEKLRSGTLSESENNQLLKLSDELEWLGVARLRALIELAAIQKTTVPKLMKQMGIAPAAYASAA